MSADNASVAPSTERIGPGTVVLIVGPSGVGKDAIVDGARRRLDDDPRFWFPQRIISRPPHEAEKHVVVTPAAFESARLGGRFALSWFAHGVGYGLPSEINERVREGKAVVFNTSRTVVETARALYVNCVVVYVDCPIDVRADRLARRGREALPEIKKRLERDVSQFSPKTADAVIDNSGPLADAIEAFVSFVRASTHPT